tara:strand:- start:3288 stop:3971 length:684 start_codon:yes stop_codon:yes gene_type:complete
MKYFIALGQIVGLFLMTTVFYWWEYLWFTGIVYFAGSCLGGTMTYHRLLAHRSWNCPRFLEKILVLLETVMLTGSAIAWVSIHREHHKHSDTGKDPHSPKFRGFLKMQFASMFVVPKIKYATDLMRDKFYVWQHKNYILINSIYGTVLFLIDPWAIAYAWLVPAALVWHLNSMIITFSHKDGFPNNNFILGLLTFGEGWHKNHHLNWKRTRLHKFDIGGAIIEKIQR